MPQPTLHGTQQETHAMDQIQTPHEQDDLEPIPDFTTYHPSDDPTYECRHCHKQGFVTGAALLTHLGVVHADYYQTYTGGRASIIA